MTYSVSETVRELWDKIEEQLNSLSAVPSTPILAVCGPVAVGKSFWSSHLIQESAKRILQLPFDLWIDEDAVRRRAIPYEKRFFFERYVFDLHRLKLGLPIEVPQTENNSWQKRRLVGDGHSPSVYQSIGKQKNCHLHMLWQDLGYATYTVDPSAYDMILVDGTLSASFDARAMCDAVLYIDVDWCCRVARMIGRFRREERITGSDNSWESYVRFLVDEALNIADRGISEQRGTATIILEVPPLGESDLADIALLDMLLRCGKLEPYIEATLMESAGRGTNSLSRRPLIYWNADT